MKTLNKNRPAFLLILVSLTLMTYSQDKEKLNLKQTGIQIGFAWNKIRETLVSKTSHAGFGLTLGLSMDKSNLHTIQHFDLNMDISFLKSRFESETGSYKLHLSVGYSYLFRISDPGPNSRLYLGPHLNTDLLISYFENWDENHYYWLTNYDLGPFVRFEKTIPSGNEFQLEFKMPLIALVSRPSDRSLVTQSSSGIRDIMRSVTGSPRVSLPLKHFELYLKTAYSIGHFRKMQPAIYWQFDYLSDSRSLSNKIISLSHTIGIETYF